MNPFPGLTKSISNLVLASVKIDYKTDISVRRDIGITTQRQTGTKLPNHAFISYLEYEKN